MIWGVGDSTVLALAAIVASVGIALMSFWWNYKTRALGHREFLYQKQIEAYAALLTNISHALYPCYDFLFTRERIQDSHAGGVSIRSIDSLEKTFP
jgi:hypothetical protein